MSATRRLNERLAKYNYMYDEDKPAPATTDEESSNGDVEVVNVDGGEATRPSMNGGEADKPSVNGEQASPNSNNNNIEVPERVPVRKLTENVSVHVNGHDKPNSSLDCLSSSNPSSEPSADLSNDIIKREASTKRDGPPTKYEAPSTKFDPSLRERDGKAEKTLRADPVNLTPRPARMDSSKSLEGYVGFANLPNQVYRKAVKRGFEFTMMLVGESGLGKSTMINSLFLSEVYDSSNPGPSMRSTKTTQIESTQVVLKESGVQLKLTLVDTPGFGDSVDNTDCWKPLTAFVDNKYDEYLNAESKVNRKVLLEDNRVHCCLYFIAPTGHSLKPLDIEVMKRLHEKVNIIPLIAKADTLTPEECRDFKKNILNEIQRHNIKIYEFPDVDDEEENRALKRLKSRVPFAVVGSNSVSEVNGRKVRCRQYPWGVVEVDNLDHNDFLALRDMLIRTHMQDLKDVTNNVHYENFRFNKLADISVTNGKVADPSRDPLTEMEDERKEHTLKLRRMESEMEDVFEIKVREKMQKLKDSERDLQNRAEQMKKSLDQQQKEIEESRRKFEADKAVWESQHGKFEDQLSLKSKTKKGMFH